MRRYKNTGENDFGCGSDLKKMTKKEIMMELLKTMSFLVIAIFAFQVAHYCLVYWEDAPSFLWFGLDTWIGIPLFIVSFLSAVHFFKKLFF